jgi:hypothetical protein
MFTGGVILKEICIILHIILASGQSKKKRWMVPSRLLLGARKLDGTLEHKK